MLPAAAAVLVISGLVAIGGAPKSPDGSKSKDQISFEDSINSTLNDFYNAPNSIAQHELILKRDASIDVLVSDWIGTVQAVSVMTNGAALEVSIGSASIVSGVWIQEGLDTVIRQRDPLYETASTLKTGDFVRVSGRILRANGRAAEISYSDLVSARNPRYIFKYTELNTFHSK